MVATASVTPSGRCHSRPRVEDTSSKSNDPVCTSANYYSLRVKASSNCGACALAMNGKERDLFEGKSSMIDFYSHNSSVNPVVCVSLSDCTFEIATHCRHVILRLISRERALVCYLSARMTAYPLCVRINTLSSFSVLALSFPECVVVLALFSFVKVAAVMFSSFEEGTPATFMCTSLTAPTKWPAIYYSLLPFEML